MRRFDCGHWLNTVRVLCLFFRESSSKKHRKPPVSNQFFIVSCGVSSWTLRPLTLNSIKGIKRGDAEIGTQRHLRRLASWSKLLGGQCLGVDWGVAGRVLWLSLVMPSSLSQQHLKRLLRRPLEPTLHFFAASACRLFRRGGASAVSGLGAISSRREPF